MLELRVLLSTFYVTSTADNGYSNTLPVGLAEASGNTTIDFYLPGYSTILLTSGVPLTVDDPTGTVTINGPGSSLLTISGDNLCQDFIVDTPLVIDGVTISGGKGGSSKGGRV